MAERSPLPHLRLLVALLLAALPLAVACGTRGPAARTPAAQAPAPVPLSPEAPPQEGLLAAHAELLRLEDRREFEEEALRRHTSDSSAAVRARAALTLGRLRHPLGAPLLLELLVDRDTAVAATAAFALGQLGDSTHAAALVARLAADAGRAPTVAAEAAYALGKIGGSRAREALRALLTSGDPAAPGNPADPAPAVGAALLSIWKLPRLASPEPIVRWLDASDPEIRWRAAYALSRRPDPRALPQLRQKLDDEDDRVRAQAVRGLTSSAADSAGIGHAALIADLIPLLDDSSYEVAINSARVLGTYPDTRAASALALAAASPRRHLALAAAEALGRVGGAAGAVAPDLARLALADSLPPPLRAAAIESLARVDPAAASPIAERFAVSPEWRLRVAAARVFAGPAGAAGGPSSNPRLRALLADADPRVVNGALQASVDEAGDDLAPLRRLLVEQLGAADAIVRATALTAISRLPPDPALLPALLDAYAGARADSLNDAALAAIDAIGAIEGQGMASSRAFLTRFRRPDDPLLRRRAVERLDSAAVVAAWGPPLPLETGRTLADYRALVDRLIAPVLSGGAPPMVALVTAGDTLMLRLHPVNAPLTVESFLRLADAGYFDGQQWPRVVPNFVIQGGDPRGDTSGGPGYTIRDEISRLRYGAGALGMALAGPDTGGSQFFITHSPQPHLDGTYAIFGQMVAGRETTERLLPGDVIETIQMVR